MENFNGNKNEANTLMDALYSVKDNTMSSINVSEVALVLSEPDADLYTCQLLSGKTNVIKAYKLDNVNVSVGSIVLVVFTDNDNRTNIRRIKQGLDILEFEGDYQHSTSYGIIVGTVATKGGSNTSVTGATQLVTKLNQLVNTQTLYVNGAWGWPLNDENKQRAFKKTGQDNYNLRHAAQINSKDKNTFAFDCVCLIKSLLWGFNFDTNASNGGAKYASNSVPDLGTEQLYNACLQKSTNFANIVPGALLHNPGHCGIYVGDGFAVECTADWEAKVIKTAVLNIGSQSGYHGRSWNHWGLLPYITY